MDKFKKIGNWSLEAKAALGVGITATCLALGIIISGSNSFMNSRLSTFSEDNSPVVGNNNNNNNNNENDEAVLETVEELRRPYNVDAKIVHYFYDMDDEMDYKKMSIVAVPGKADTYMKSMGVDYAFDGKEFDVVSSINGKVIDRLVDPIYGNMLVIEHSSGIKTIYSSLGEFKVAKGENVTQGQIIATSGESLYLDGLGESLHFEVIKNDTYINPEKSYSMEVKNL